MGSSRKLKMKRTPSSTPPKSRWMNTATSWMLRRSQKSRRRSRRSKGWATTPADDLRAKIDELQDVAQKIGEQVYQASQESSGGEEAKDAEFSEKEEEKPEEKDEKKKD